MEQMYVCTDTPRSMRHGGLCLDIGIWILYARSELEQKLFEKESGENDFNNVKLKLDFRVMLWTATRDIENNLVLKYLLCKAPFS